MAAQLFFTEAAQADLDRLFAWIAARAGEERARAYVGRIERACHGLLPFPQRGTARDDVRPGLRIVGFERRVSIAFTVRGGDVIVLRILYAGRNLGGAFGPEA
ncbi:type II toxin-antitoxin system RelE/ParE family toxin [Rhodoplanes serenus]|jgi:toxin ParE1/3/4|uniref:Type II toxin-antitoxin system RelE/ParE family toxin n=1 Tax=Rhodoplanes serenus TaxID=200615 RepID=A0A9X4XHY4_9BRAD|nr:type II toxin-antitoxin system RelE/ParE family toxin [Rhodoplanes serenus]MTW15460.1 type II toxin-antitoxin system RelE/ParE family toxin [Rhodoplanes serenus]